MKKQRESRTFTLVELMVAVALMIIMVGIIATIFKEGGELIPCLGRNYLSYSESLRRDIESLFAFVGRQAKRGPDLTEYLRLAEGKKDEGR